MNKSIVYPLLATAGLGLLLATAGCADRDLGEMRKQIKLTRLEAQLQDEQRIAAHKAVRAQVAGIQGSKTVADAYDKSFGTSDDTTPCKHGHGSGHYNGMHGVHVDVNGDVYVDVNQGNAPYENRPTAPQKCGSFAEIAK